MPAIITHHLFGAEVYSELAAVIGKGADERDAFLLGNIGPDPLFCLRTLPHSVPYRDLGATMHNQKPADLLAAVHRHLIAHGYAGDSIGGNPAVAAYALGFLCHYLLDSTVHPLVYAQQYALCDAGIDGLTRERSGSETHALIETELDEYTLTTHRGITVKEFEPHRETLKCRSQDLLAISLRLASVACEVYELPVSPTAFASSVQLYRAAQVVLDSKRDGLRRYFDYARLTNRRYLHVLMLTHSAILREDTPFANNEHFCWPHPFGEEGAVRASFDELYQTAFEKALNAVPRFARTDFTDSDCESLTGNINFKGKLIDACETPGE